MVVDNKSSAWRRIIPCEPVHLIQICGVFDYPQTLIYVGNLLIIFLEKYPILTDPRRQKLL
jgi:hypothetical protein